MDEGVAEPAIDDVVIMLGMKGRAVLHGRQPAVRTRDAVGIDIERGQISGNGQYVRHINGGAAKLAGAADDLV